MKVQAVPGARCPKEGKPREYITDSKTEEVPDSVYYRRLVADGSLVIEKASEIVETAEKKGGKK
ncbi:MAG: hypothetical protein EG826_04495 [Deltaproteobacteria bacterium]|nr:hypothetical protein [Deltaproteobacteria bacterium]